jgi:hypothetical protein
MPHEQLAMWAASYETSHQSGKERRNSRNDLFDEPIMRAIVPPFLELYVSFFCVVTMHPTNL